jgi:peptidoglycan/LPS O-acetylase OafA/YrhL
LIWLAAAGTWGAVVRALDWPPVAFLGTLSYSLYLWQQPFLDPYSQHWLFKPPVSLVPVFGCAALSYFVAERRFLRVKHRLGQRQHG